MDVLYIDTDGACTSNPGEMGIGAFIRSDQKIIEFITQKLDKGSNNEAEYWAVYYALVAAKKRAATNVTVRSDSQLIVNQLNGDYKVKSESLFKIHDKIKRMVQDHFEKVEFVWVPREQNKFADALASHAIGMNNAIVDKINFKIEFWEADSTYTPNPEDFEDLPCLNPETSFKINQLNQKDANKFKDFIELKTYGIDGYSKLKENDLLEIIEIRYGERTIEFLEKALEGTTTMYLKNVYKWIARGLNPNDAFKKVSVDIEMAGRS